MAYGTQLHRRYTIYHTIANAERSNNFALFSSYSCSLDLNWMNASLNEYFTEWVLHWMSISLNEYFTEWVLYWMTTSLNEYFTFPLRLWPCNKQHLETKKNFEITRRLHPVKFFSITSHFTCYHWLGFFLPTVCKKLT